MNQSFLVKMFNALNTTTLHIQPNHEDEMFCSVFAEVGVKAIFCFLLLLLA